MFQICTTCFVLALSVGISKASVIETAKQNGCTKLFDLVKTADLKQALDSANGLTLFAPSNAAIDDLPSEVTHALTTNKTLLQEVLAFHVAVGMMPSTYLKNDQLLPTLSGNSKIRINKYQAGKVMTVEGNPVSTLDIRSSNGFVHVIDKVIYPIPVMTTPLYLTFDSNLSNLGYMVYRGNLFEKLSEQSFTVFAPSNAAIEKIPGQKYNDLLSNLTALTTFLTYHVIPGAIYSAGLTDGQKVKTLQGLELEVQISADCVKINGVKIIMSDISTTNGVIHVIDSILSPPSDLNSTPNHATDLVVG